MPAPVIDPFGRRISYLRVSVTDRCDMRCVYCMAEEMIFLPRSELLDFEELERLCGAFISLGVRRMRITGGEPLVRRGVVEFLRDLLGVSVSLGSVHGVRGTYALHVKSLPIVTSISR